MKFVINRPLNTQYPQAVLPSSFAALTPVATPSLTRRLLLFEAEDEYGRLKPSLGTVEDGVMEMMDPATETPLLNSTEMWEIFNATEDAHPIHLHLVNFRVINSQNYHADVDETTGALSNIHLYGPVRIPGPAERGWKDTYVMFPGEVTRLVATFDRAGKYMWHCHILSHEDHEMMRPFIVVEALREAAQDKPGRDVLEQNFPNPFSSASSFTFNLEEDAMINLSIYNPGGEKIVELINELVPSGSHTVNLDADGLSNGVYYYALQTGDKKLMRKMVVLK